MRLIPFAVLFLWNSVITSSQGTNFVLNVDQTQISQDQYIEASFTLTNAQGKAFTPPDFNGWTVISGPSTSSQVSIFNGVRTSNVSYIYSLSPKSTGTLIIGKASIQVNGKTFYTDPVQIKVTKSSPTAKLSQGAKALSKKDIFILAKATPDQAYVGQQILVEYKIYTAVNVDNFNIAHLPDFNGFHVNNTPRGSQDARETIHGRTYVTKVIHTASIYPIQGGNYELDALHVRANVVTDEGNDPNSFFLLPNTVGVDLMSNTVPVKVLSLPLPAPANYSGAVGHFKIASSLDQINVNVNDAISLTVYMEGDGDLNRVGKPFINVDSTAFQQYEPKITKENTDYKNSGFIGLRELIFPLVASKPGNHAVIPSFIYFDTDSARYVTAAPQVFNINVSGTAITQNNNAAIPGKVDAPVVGLIQYPSLGHSTFVGSGFYYMLLIFPFITFAGLMLRDRLQQKKIQANHHATELYKVRQASINAIHALGLEPQPGPDNITRINEVLKDYLRKKWDITDLSLSNAQWNEYIDRATLSDDLKSKIKSILRESEVAIYGGQLTQGQLRAMQAKAMEIIEHC